MIKKGRKFNTAFITGITGSGGSYLAEYIISNDLIKNVAGSSRWHSTSSSNNVKSIKEKIKIFECDLNDLSAIIRTLKSLKPDVIFHLASHANVKVGFELPISVLNNNIMSTVNLFEAIRLCEIDPLVLMCSTSEVYGKVDKINVPINENCPINPASPYAVSKVTQDLLCNVYNNSYGLKTIRTRMFSYINPRREDLFATAFAKQIVMIENGIQDTLYHGNLESVRTIIDHRDAMNAYWSAVKHCDIGDVYNIGGEKIISVGEFLEILIKKANCNIKVKIDKNLMRPNDVTLQIPDSSKFKKTTNWKTKFSFEESVDFLLEYWRKKLKRL